MSIMDSPYNLPTLDDSMENIGSYWTWLISSSDDTHVEWITPGRVLLTAAYIGTVVYSLNGTVTGAKSGLNVFGAIVVGCLEAVGGGTLRDVVILNTRAFWVDDFTFLWMSIGTGFLTFFLWPKVLDCHERRNQRDQQSIDIESGNERHYERKYTGLDAFLDSLDAFALSANAVFGAHKAFDEGMSMEICILSAMITASFGGVTRDVLCGRPVRILRSALEIYAELALLCALVYLVAKHAGASPSVQIGLAFCAGTGGRFVAVVWDIKLHTWDTTGDNLGVTIRQKERLSWHRRAARRRSTECTMKTSGSFFNDCSIMEFEYGEHFRSAPTVALDEEEGSESTISFRSDHGDATDA